MQQPHHQLADLPTFASLPTVNTRQDPQRYFRSENLFSFYSFLHQSFSYLLRFFKQSLSFLFRSRFLKSNLLFLFCFRCFINQSLSSSFLSFLVCKKHVFTLLFTSTKLVSSSRILKQNITLISMLT